MDKSCSRLLQMRRKSYGRTALEDAYSDHADEDVWNGEESIEKAACKDAAKVETEQPQRNRLDIQVGVSEIP